MPYPTVIFSSAIASLANAKLTSEEASILIRTKAVVPAIKTAVQNHKTWSAAAHTRQEQIKKLLETNVAKVKEMQQMDWVPNPFTIEEVKSTVGIIETTASFLNGENKAYSEAFAGDGMRDLNLSKPMLQAFPQMTVKHAEELVAFASQARSKIIEQDRGLVAIRTRIDEYGKRAEILVQAAVAAQAKAFGRQAVNAQVLDKAIVNSNAHVKEVEENLKFVAGKHKTLESLLKTPPSAKTAPTCKGLAAERAERMKGAKGSLKTLDQELTAAEEGLKAAPELGRRYKAPLGSLRLQYTTLNSKIQTLLTKTIPDMDGRILETLKVKL